MKKNIIIFLIIISGLFIKPVLAADDIIVHYTPTVSIPGSKFLANTPLALPHSTATLCDYIMAWYKFGIGVIGMLAAIAVAFGGVLLVVSQGNSGSISKAKGWIQDGLIAIVIASGSYLLLSTINRELVICQPLAIAQIDAQATEVYKMSTCIMANSCKDGYDAKEKAFCMNPDGSMAPGSGSQCCCPNERMKEESYCLDKSDGATCKTTSGDWGYCEYINALGKRICRTCKSVSYQNTATAKVENFPEQQRCYHNDDVIGIGNWECPNRQGICGDLRTGDCDARSIGQDVSIGLAQVRECWADYPVGFGLGGHTYVGCICKPDQP